MGVLRDRTVEVGGRGLHVVEGGRGTPAVVLEAGFGCDSGLWREVQERVARVTAAYSYDRADHASSDPAGRDVAGMVLVDARHQRWGEMLPDLFHARLRELDPDNTEQALHADEVVRALPGPGPLTVITHGRADWIPEKFGFGPAELDRCEQAWQEMQRDLAAQSAGSVFRVAAESGHLIPAEQPDLVADEILALVRL